MVTSASDSPYQPSTYNGGGINLGEILQGYDGGVGGGGTRIGQGAYGGTPLVYWGAPTKGEAFHDYHPEGQTKTLDDALVSFTQFPDVEQKALANKLYRAGILDDPNDLYGAYDQWQKAVSYASEQYTFGGKKLTPWDVLQTRLGMESKKRGPQTKTSTSTHAQVLSNGDADAMVKAIYQQNLGRDPTDGELSRYRSMLINKVKANPTTTRTTTKYDADGTPVDTSSVDSGGLSSAAQADFLTEKNQADPEWGAYQAATKYYNLLNTALAAPGGSG